MYYFRLIKTIFVLNLCFVFVHDVYSQSGSEAPNGSKRNSKYKVAVCDWMILKRQKIGEFELAKQLGADGIELDMGSLGQRDSFDNKLRKPDFQLLFKQKIKETGVEIASVAMSGFYAQSLATRKNYMALIQDCLNTMQAMGAKTAFLPLGVQCDLQLHPELRNVVVERLKVIGGMAEKAGVVWNRNIAKRS
jgi:sugar phosphate isomerase/epimerase